VTLQHESAPKLSLVRNHDAVAQYETHTLTLVIQRVATRAEDVRADFAKALLEYARDLDEGTAGNGVFERHVNAGCRIEAIKSVPPCAGAEAREDVVAADGMGALSERIHHARELAGFLAGGESDNEIGAALGYTRDQAASALRDKLDETLAALPA
jgi:hypothetical protein